MDQEWVAGLRWSNAGLVTRARNRLARSEQRLAVSAALLRGSQLLLPAVPPVLREGGPPAAWAALDEQDEVRILREIGLSLRSAAREICMEAQEVRWLTQQTRERARQERARAAGMRRDLMGKRPG